MVTFALAYLAERRQRAEAKKAEEASAARPLSCVWGSVLESNTPSEAAENFVLIKASKRWLQPTRSRGLQRDRNWGMLRCSRGVCVCVCVCALITLNPEAVNPIKTKP